MKPRQIIKILLPALLFITTFFPVYMPFSRESAVTVYTLVSEMPLAAFVPILFFASLTFAFTKIKWSARFSAIAAVLGIVLAFIVNQSTDTSAATPELYTAILLILYTLVAPVAYGWLLISSIIARRRKTDLHKDSSMPMLAMSPRRLALLLIISFNFYGVYWFYQNWKAIQVREGLRIRPFWRVVFSIFWLYPLFRQILGDAQKHGYGVRFSASLLTGVYIFLALSSAVVSFFVQSPWWQLAVSVVGLVSYVLILISVQQAANFSNSRLSSPPALRSALTKGETIVLTIGVISMLFSIVSIFNSPRLSGKLEQQRALLQKSAALYAEYEKCASALNERLPQLNTEDQTAVDAYNADYDKCEAVRLEQNRVVDEYNRSRFQLFR